MKKETYKLVVAVIVSLYFLWCAYDPYQWHLTLNATTGSAGVSPATERAARKLAQMAIAKSASE
jgi:hypothetical protein